MATNPNTIISYPDAAAPLDGTEAYAAWQNGGQKQITGFQLAQFLLGGIGTPPDASAVASDLSAQLSAMSASQAAVAAAIQGGLATSVSAGGALPFEVTGITGGGGSGGTPGTYAGITAGGPPGFRWQVVVGSDGKAVPEIVNPGISTSNSAPTLTMPTIAGLTGATTPTATVGVIPNGRVFYAPSADGTQVLAWGNNAGALAAAPFGGTQVSIYAKAAIDALVPVGTGYITSTIKQFTREQNLPGSAWRFRVGNRLYGTFDATLGFYFRKLRITANATVDDNVGIPLGQRLLAGAVGAYFKRLPNELAGSKGAMRWRIGNRLLATLDLVNGLYPRRLTIPANAKVDDDLSGNISTRLVASGMSGYFAKIGVENGGVLRFRWGHRLIGQWTKAGGMFFTRMTLPADVKLSDLPSTNLTDRLGGSGGTAAGNANWVAISAVDSNGKFQISTHRRSDGLRVQLTSGATSYRAPFVTPDDKVLFYSDGDARMMYAPALGGVINPVNPYNTVACYGDSLTAGAGSSNNGPYPSQLAVRLGSAVTAVNNRGVGGNTSVEIEARDGGAPPVLTFPSNQIPASGTVNVATWSISPITAQGPAGSAMTGYVTDTAGNKIYGTLTATAFDVGQHATALTFTRTTAGSAAPIASGGTAFISDLGVADRNSIKLFCYGRNNNALTSQILASLAAGVAYQTPYVPRFLVGAILMGISPVQDTEATRVQIAASNAAIQAAYPNNWVDLNAPPTANEMSVIGYTLDYETYCVPGTNTPTGRTDAADIAGQATGLLTFTANPAANDTLTLNGKSITFVAGAPGANQVQIGADAITTATNLAAYVGANTGVIGMAAIAVQVAGVAYVIVTANAAGTGGNSLALAASSAAITLSGGTLTGGSAYGTVPSGMRSAAAIPTADYLHLNNAGYALWTLRWYRALLAHGWFPTLPVI